MLEEEGQLRRLAYDLPCWWKFSKHRKSMSLNISVSFFDIFVYVNDQSKRELYE
jgi:hypothetical protein